MEGKIYFDNLASAPLLAEVYRNMLDSFDNTFASPASLHSYGYESSDIINASREKIAKLIGATGSELNFTSSSAESNSWAILGLARVNSKKGKHIIISAIEDRSVIESAEALKKEGFEVSYVPVDSNGIIKYSELIKTIRRDTILISVMTANGIIGTVQPIHAIGKLAKMNGILFHTDASYAVGEIEIDVHELSIDAMTISSNSICGPNGIAGLYVKKGVKIDSIIFGDESDKNTSTRQFLIPLVVGFSKAVEIAVKNMQYNVRTRKRLRKLLYKKIKENIANVELIGHPRQRISGNLNLSFEGVNGEAVSIFLDRRGVEVSSSESPNLYPSHVIRALDLDSSKLFSNVRFSLSTLNTEEEINTAVVYLTKIVKKLRSVSPVRVYNMRGGK